MSYKTSERNYDRIQFEALRRKVDPKFNQLHDELSEAYYDYWKHGKSKLFQEYDVQAIPEESKALFDKLHGLIFHLRDVELNTENEIQSQPDVKLREHLHTKRTRQEWTQIDTNKFEVTELDGNSLLEESQARIEEARTKGLEITS